jgi:hypothetical protein
MTTGNGELFYWRVRVWDVDSNVSAWSTDGYFIPYSIPSVTTTTSLLLSGNKISLTGDITDLGGSLNNEYGFVYGSSVNPTIANTKVVLGTTNQVMTYKHTTQVMPSGTYYFRSYVTGIAGTGYGVSIQVVIPTLTKTRSEITERRNAPSDR